MKTLAFIITVGSLISLYGCQTSPTEKNTQTKTLDSTFHVLSEQFVNNYLKWNPEYATQAGFHEYDGKLSDYSAAGLELQHSEFDEYRARLESISPDSLSEKAKLERTLILSAIRRLFFMHDNLKVLNTNPMVYAGAIDVNIYIQRDFAPIEQRMQSIINILRKSPEVFAAAKKNLSDSLPRPFIETAILIARGAADFLDKEVKEALQDVKVDSLQKAFASSKKLATTELRNFASYLENEKLKKATNQYAIGEANYREMLFANEMITTPPREILEQGLQRLKKEQELFAAVARKIDPNKSAIAVFEDLKKEHPTGDELIKSTDTHVESIRQFLIDKNIVTLPSEVRVKVTETPQFRRATSTASMDTPGPFEKSATQAYYYITPVEKNWSAKQKEEWLGQFNYYVTDITSIHEAYPGHYTQFLHLNASDASKAQKVILGSYAFVEGWAHYTEQMMIEEGFAQTADSLTSAKYRLAQLNESLLRYCRLVVSIRTHLDGMQLPEATKFFQDNCYYDYKPAYQEALRGTFDPGYLSYTLGKLQILQLREDYKKQEGAKFSLQKFHDAMLDNGMPPIELLRPLLLKKEKLQ
jgi:uncharacterized protein (DUF885 family)